MHVGDFAAIAGAPEESLPCWGARGADILVDDVGDAACGWITDFLPTYQAAYFSGRRGEGVPGIEDDLPDLGVRFQNSQSLGHQVFILDKEKVVLNEGDIIESPDSGK